MKTAQMVIAANAGEARLRDYDLREIDAPDPRGHFSLKYLARLQAAIKAVQGHVPAGGRVLEVGCAQANASLLLAEAGYLAVALDLMPDALTYARRKHEYGAYVGVCGSAEALPVRSGSFDAVLVGELLEHCARPGRILATLAQALCPGGVVVITTPNGGRMGAGDPTYSQVDPESVEGRQFGPGGEDHLFAFTLPELKGVVREAGLTVLQASRCGSSLHSDRLGLLKRLLPVGAIRGASAAACGLPGIGPLTALSLLVVARKGGG